MRYVSDDFRNSCNPLPRDRLSTMSQRENNKNYTFLPQYFLLINGKKSVMLVEKGNSVIFLDIKLNINNLYCIACDKSRLKWVASQKIEVIC